MELRTEFCGFNLEGPLMNAAGTCKVVSEVREFATAPISGIVAGSYTYNSQLGNSGTTYYSDQIRSSNSKGIPNGGREYLKQNLPEMVSIAHDAGKVLIVSVSGNKPEENAELVSIAVEGGADAVEVNLACPNLWLDGGKQKPIICFYPDMIDAITSAVVVPEGYALGWKLSHYSNPIERIERVAQLVRVPTTRFVTLCNTYPNVFGADGNGQPWIGPEYGGMGGAAVKPMAEAHVRAAHQSFPGLAIVGVGGVGCRPKNPDEKKPDGQDLMDYKKAGATVVEVATAYFERGLSVFSDIMHQYTDLLEKQATTT